MRCGNRCRCKSLSRIPASSLCCYRCQCKSKTFFFRIAASPLWSCSCCPRSALSSRPVPPRRLLIRSACERELPDHYLQFAVDHTVLRWFAPRPRNHGISPPIVITVGIYSIYVLNTVRVRYATVALFDLAVSLNAEVYRSKSVRYRIVQYRILQRWPQRSRTNSRPPTYSALCTNSSGTVHDSYTYVRVIFINCWIFHLQLQAKLLLQYNM